MNECENGNHVWNSEEPRRDALQHTWTCLVCHLRVVEI